MSNKASLAITGNLIEPTIFRELQLKQPTIQNSKQRVSINYMPIQRKATISPSTTITTNTVPLSATKTRSKHICKLGSSLDDLNQLNAKEKKAFEVCCLFHFSCKLPIKMETKEFFFKDEILKLKKKVEEYDQQTKSLTRQMKDKDRVIEDLENRLEVTKQEVRNSRLAFVSAEEVSKIFLIYSFEDQVKIKKIDELQNTCERLKSEMKTLSEHHTDDVKNLIKSTNTEYTKLASEVYHRVIRPWKKRTRLGEKIKKIPRSAKTVFFFSGHGVLIECLI